MVNSKFVATLVFFTFLSGHALACVKLNSNTGVFFNQCGYDVIVSFKTSGGGCFMNGNGTTTIKNGGSSATAISQRCGNSYSWRNYWAWCKYSDWVEGTCSPRP